MLSITRDEHIQAAETWDAAFQVAYQRALADALVACLAELPHPTIADALKFCEVSGYDHTNELRVDIAIGDVLGLPGEGPAFSDIFEALEELEPTELDTAITRRLADLLED